MAVDPTKYITLAEVKRRLEIPFAETTWDPDIDRIIGAVSRWIDARCHRQFFIADDTRAYTADWPDLVRIDDVLTVTQVATDLNADRTYETIWDPLDFFLEPHAAAWHGKPYTRIRPVPYRGHRFPAHWQGVQVTGTFGYALAPPDEVREATLLQTARLFKRTDAPFGIAGSLELGQTVVLTRLDPDVQTLLGPLMRIDRLVA
ncbi:MAG: hypothetical protein GEU73_06070 [Chloroflexi bacterium]|nr:hypothetical protein [Chloroflexota bacterium]